MDKDEIWNKTLVLLLEDTDEEDPKTVFLLSLIHISEPTRH